MAVSAIWLTVARVGVCTNGASASTYALCGGGQGEVYAYTPLNDTNKKVLLAIPPGGQTNSDYGISTGRGAWNFEPGVWTTVAERVKLNEIGQANGLILREGETSHIKGMHFQTFFGGHTSDWASPKDQYAWFADVSGVIIR
ncbi:polysaccharide lyase family 14 protein [Hydnomerulius pinastri MD-312]|uniref:Polysaccharide lyase family 14 protein n=1 Tax=Hydnomerulius pinastri MD-312 TaxID=994086 RepID=A0A0C9W7X8_9AGAM|nr:polysaccharide lyase family 14 protein [Hydnomerulius pinastri MD-312]